MSATQIISDNIVFTDYNTGNEISSAIEGQKVGITVPVKNISSSGYIILLQAQLFRNGTLIEDYLIYSEQYMNSGETKEWSSFFYMPDGDALVTLHSYTWSSSGYSLDYTTQVLLHLTSEEEVAGWNLLKTMEVTLFPSVEEVAGWNLLKTITVTLSPSTEEVAGWNLLKTIEVTVLPSGEVPPPACTVDADCPEGYECVGGKCVKKKVEGEVPWAWIAAGAVGIGGIVLLTGGKKPAGKKKT